MANFIPVPFTSECHVRFQQGPNLGENIFAYQWSGSPPSGAQLLTLATEVAASIALRMTQVMHTSNVFREVYCRNLDVEFANNATYLFPGGTIGTRGGSAVASNEANGLIKRTGFTGRGMHGRNSFSNFAEGDVDGNSIANALMALFLNLAAEIVLARVAGSFKAAVAKRHVTVPRSVQIASCIDLDNNIDSQKTRLNSHGR